MDDAGVVQEMNESGVAGEDMSPAHMDDEENGNSPNQDGQGLGGEGDAAGADQLEGNEDGDEQFDYE